MSLLLLLIASCATGETFGHKEGEIFPIQLIDAQEVKLKQVEVDLVYTWVQEPTPQQYIHKMKDCDGGLGGEGLMNMQRFRNMGTLRHSLRSVILNLPWVRTIFVVTNGEFPCWLQEKGKVKFVTHADIFKRKEDLPTYNSEAIEVNLHYIKRLSEHFIYFNDDWLVGKHLKISDFFNPDNGFQLHRPNSLGEHNIWLKSGRDWTGRITDRGIPLSHGNDHHPISLSKFCMSEMWNKYSSKFERTSGLKCRESGGLISPITMIKNRCTRKAASRRPVRTTYVSAECKQTYKHDCIPPNSSSQDMVEILTNGGDMADFVTINDNFTLGTGYTELATNLHDALDVIWPTKLPFEDDTGCPGIEEKEAKSEAVVSYYDASKLRLKAEAQAKLTLGDVTYDDVTGVPNIHLDDIKSQVQLGADNTLLNEHIHEGALLWYELNNAQSSKKLEQNSTIRVAVFNAERGWKWREICKFIKESPVLTESTLWILNEMDLGVARSNNEHTTKKLAECLQMNYAYGIEFVELTEGTADEQKRVKAHAAKSTHGFHGNALLSSYQFEKSSTRVIRFDSPAHETANLWFDTSPAAQHTTEKRLGGRMGLVSGILLTNGETMDVAAVHLENHRLHGNAKYNEDALAKIGTLLGNKRAIIGGDIPCPPGQQNLPVPLRTSHVGEFGTVDTLSRFGFQLGRDTNPPRWTTKPSPSGDWILMKGVVAAAGPGKVAEVHSGRQFSDHNFISLQIHV